MSDNLERRFWEAATNARFLTANVTKQSEGSLTSQLFSGYGSLAWELVRFKAWTSAKGIRVFDQNEFSETLFLLLKINSFVSIGL
jgi:hypothetical protein